MSVGFSFFISHFRLIRFSLFIFFLFFMEVGGNFFEGMPVSGGEAGEYGEEVADEGLVGAVGEAT